MYSRFVKILKFIQLLGYIAAIFIAYFYSSFLFNRVGVVFLVTVTYLCLANYIVTQPIIAVIDLLNRIETNTRNIRHD
ncbi:hypothetical protein NIES593_21525 [Hydrococcus rivularis NIES-593]|uniref:Uncharacterized protein n=1 Tax=Hydrococcus rivularis NIES-593 TaxID=1921803 RepID=A0A1U7H834_9CYAN|nr:hypothetical protein NIES593_21525 [Hydrococcus rivularis NIES-593]